MNIEVFNRYNQLNVHIYQNVEIIDAKDVFTVIDNFTGRKIEYTYNAYFWKEIKMNGSNNAKEARRKSLIKLELVQYPYSKSGPTVYLDDYQIAGPRAYGVGHTVASYELKKENLKDIQRIVTRELNRMNGIE